MASTYYGDTFERGGLTFRVTFPRCDDMGAPWEEHDGHGVVSDWERRDKRPSERILATDRYSKRFYDVRASMELALRDGWGLSPEAIAAWTAKTGRAPTKREQAAAAVDADFERLRRWCNDDWYWVGVVVERLDEDGEPTGEQESVWGIESDCEEYLTEVAHEHADQIIEAHRTAWRAALHEARQRRYWAARDVVTR